MSTLAEFNVGQKTQNLTGKAFSCQTYVGFEEKKNPRILAGTDGILVFWFSQSSGFSTKLAVKRQFELYNTCINMIDQRHPRVLPQ
jgi:hypothetical protein